MKKILLFLAILAAVTGNAGTWKVHSCYQTSKIQNVYDTGDKIYYLNSGNLFQFDKATTKTIVLNKQNKLSDNQISQIYFDWQNQLLFVAYLDCNLDIIDNTGAVYNLRMSAIIRSITTNLQVIPARPSMISRLPAVKPMWLSITAM